MLDKIKCALNSTLGTSSFLPLDTLLGNKLDSLSSNIDSKLSAVPKRHAGMIQGKNATTSATTVLSLTGSGFVEVYATAVSLGRAINITADGVTTGDYEIVKEGGGYYYVVELLHDGKTSYDSDFGMTSVSSDINALYDSYEHCKPLRIYFNESLEIKLTGSSIYYRFKYDYDA